MLDVQASLSDGALTTQSSTDNVLNLFGAGGVLVSLVGTFNVSVFLLEAVWVAISAYGIARTLKLRRESAIRR